LTVAIAGNMGDSVDNQASVGNSSIGGGVRSPGNVDTATILHPSVATSTKTVQDINGGDAEPGDTLRYIVKVIESAGAAATNLSVIDSLQTGLSSLAVNAAMSTCSGSDASTTTQLSWSGISLAANGSCTIVFDALLSPYAEAGIEIDN